VYTSKVSFSGFISEFICPLSEPESESQAQQRVEHGPGQRRGLTRARYSHRAAVSVYTVQVSFSGFICFFVFRAAPKIAPKKTRDSMGCRPSKEAAA
jgi:hypothetical protein